MKEFSWNKIPILILWRLTLGTNFLVFFSYISTCKIILMKLLYSLLFFLSAFVYSAKKDKDEAFFITMLKEGNIEKKLLESQVFRSCTEVARAHKSNTDDYINKTKECIQNEIKGLSKTQTEKLLESLNLSATELYADKDNLSNLSNYLGQIVEMALYGNEYKTLGETKFAKVDQEMFTRIYERIVGKSLFNELSNYCLKFDPNKGEKKKIEEITEEQDINTYIGNCIKSIREECKIDDGNVNEKAAQACLFRRRLVEFKTILSKLEKDKQYYENAKNADSILEVSYLDKNILSKRSAGEVASDITSISSRDIVDEGYQEKHNTLSNQAKMMEEQCVKNPSDVNCKDFFKKGSAESLAGYRLQRELELDLKIKKLDESSLPALKEEATKSNYFSDEKLKELLSGSEDEIKNAILEEYKKEQLSIRTEINNKIANIGIKKDETLGTNVKSKLDNLHKILEKRPDELRAITFFSHVIAAHSTFDHDQSKKKRILTGIDEEIKALKALQEKTNDDRTKKALEFLENIKKENSSASKEDNYEISPREIDRILFGD